MRWRWRSADEERPYPDWIKLPVTAWTLVLIPIYWRDYGPTNFLWFSDIALFAVVVSLWTRWRLPYSMMAVGVLPLEMVWFVDFFAGGSLFGAAAYMFEGDRPAYLRALSLFHLFLPPVLVLMLYRQGYDERAVFAQTALAWIVLPVTWLLTDPADNINAVWGLDEVQSDLHPLAYLALYMAALPLLVHLPMHFVLRRVFGPRG